MKFDETYMEDTLDMIDDNRKRTVRDFEIKDKTFKVYFGKSFDMVEYPLPIKYANEDELEKLKATIKERLKTMVERDSEKESMLSKKGNV